MINVLPVLVHYVFLAFPILAACQFESHFHKSKSKSNLGGAELLFWSLVCAIFPFILPVVLVSLVLAEFPKTIMLSALLVTMTVKLPILTVLLAMNMIQTKLFADSDNAWVRNLVIAGYVCSASLGVYATVAKESMIMLNAQRLIGPKVAQAATFISAKVYANTHNNSCSSPN